MNARTPELIAIQAILDCVTYDEYEEWCLCNNYMPVSASRWNELVNSQLNSIRKAGLTQTAQGRA